MGRRPLSTEGADLSSRRDKEDRATDSTRHVFGPVASGRLGLSLGLDLLGARICTFDCLYCEAGVTEALTTARKPYVPARRILGELADWKAAGHGLPDAVTLGGLGEPCLNTDCGEIIAGARELFPDVPVAVLTNSSLLSDPDVRSALSGADIVLPSMDTLVTAEYQCLNRPHKSLGLEAIRQGLLDFRAGFAGSIFLEILLVAGQNDSAENLELLRDFCRELAPTRVDVVTLSRPGAHPGAKAVAGDVLARFREVLGAVRPVPSAPSGGGHGPAGFWGDIAARAPRDPGLTDEDLAARIAASVARRPQTAAGLATALGLPVPRIQSALDALLRTGAVRRERSGQDIFYSG
uniref:Fe-S oxidoreductase n=1 Tax=Desulfovibrio sp. U5L TaxID=596152 RepID=I2PZS6_9BACT